MGLRMKRRIVTTQEAAAEDDRSAGLQIGSVGVRGQMMNAHSKIQPERNMLAPPGSTGGIISSSWQETMAPKKVFIVMNDAF